MLLTIKTKDKKMRLVIAIIGFTYLHRVCGIHATAMFSCISLYALVIDVAEVANWYIKK